jgi:hypothetical protein
VEIGFISDTHGYLDLQVLECFRDCDEIWHAGDFGSVEVARQLAALKPLRGVSGNIDDEFIRDEFPEQLRFNCAGVDVMMVHIGGRPGRYEPHVRERIMENRPSVLVCGHSHILHVENDKRFSGMKYINPGAAGRIGTHLVRTILKGTVADGVMGNLRVIELGPRNAAMRQ